MKAGWFAVVLAAALLMPETPFAQDIRQERVHFAAGASSATMEGRIKGYQIVDYVLGARKGQTMNASLATDNASNYFNILAPGENETAFFTGSSGGNQFEGVLPATGDYKLRVYLMRNAARRNEAANYRLEMSISDGGQTQAAPGESKTVATAEQGSFDATGPIPCAQHTGQPMGQCTFGVNRRGGGTATVVITAPDGRTRTLFFADGKFSGADVSQADGNLKTSATRESDLNLVRVGNERYKIPDAVLFGG